MKRYYYTTPSSYLELIKLYKIMLHERRDKIEKTRDRIANGLQVILCKLLNLLLMLGQWSGVFGSQKVGKR